MRSTLLALALFGMLASGAFAAGPPKRGPNGKPPGKSVYVVIQKGSTRQLIRIDFGEIERPEPPSTIAPSETAPKAPEKK